MRCQPGFARTLDSAVLIGALATIPLTLLAEETPVPTWVPVADWAVWTVFLLEYVVLLAAAPDRLRFVRRNPLRLAVIVISYPHLPAAFGLVRLARFVRFLRVARVVGVTARAITALRDVFGRRGVVGAAVISSLIIVAGGAAIALLEPQTVHGGLADGIWWAIVTASTVGYGDIAPVTPWGRLIAVLLMLCGVGMISTLAASITACFLGQEENAALADLAGRVARVEKLLQEIVDSPARAEGRSSTTAPAPGAAASGARSLRSPATRP
jgi:voltage-gated potassium channel